MDERKIDSALEDLRGFRNPPPPPLDEMWAVIEDTHFNVFRSQRVVNGKRRVPLQWLAAAATLLIGVAIGRYAIPPGVESVRTESVAASSALPPAAAPATPAAEVYREETNRYLGQAAALLISLPSQQSGESADARFASRAGELLMTTRLLMDSPAAQDTKLRALLEDLELVLVQIARLRSQRNHSDLDLINQAVEQGDVLSRLNSAAATTQSSE